MWIYWGCTYIYDIFVHLKSIYSCRPKRIPYFGDSGHLIQRALEASLSRHSPQSGQQTPDNLQNSPDTRNSSPDNGSSYTLIRYYPWGKEQLKNWNVHQVCSESSFELERGAGWWWWLRWGGEADSDLLEGGQHYGVNMMTMMTTMLTMMIILTLML